MPILALAKIDKYGDALFGLKPKVFDFPVPLTKVAVAQLRLAEY